MEGEVWNTGNSGWSPETIERRRFLFDQYVTPYLNMIYKLCINYSHGYSNVQENYVEVLENLYRYIDTYDPSKPILTWLHIITKRYIAEVERKRKRDNMRDDTVDVEDLLAYGYYDSQEASGNALGVDNYRQHYNDDILATLDKMKPIHREALIMQQSGYSLKEIAEIEHSKGELKSNNIETVKSRLLCARKELRDNINRNGQRRKAD